MINAFGLDIGSSLIKAVWLGGGGGQFSLKSCISFPSTVKGMSSESPFDQEEMAQILHKLVTDAKITTKSVHLALPDGQVYTKVIDMPPLSEKELASAINWEAEQYIPAPLETITLSWSVLRKDPQSTGQNAMQVLLVGAPTVMIQKYQHILKLAGLTIVSIETEIIAAIRSCLAVTNGSSVLLINIGAMSTTIAIVQNGIICFTYTVPIGGVGMSRAIAVDFGFSLAQAEEYKKIYGMADKNLGDKIGHAIEPILLSLLGEVKKALAFYNEKYKNTSPISQITLSGGSAKMPGIDLYFVQNLGIETITANPWQTHRIQGVPQQLQDNASQFGVVVGLAMKENE